MTIPAIWKKIGKEYERSKSLRAEIGGRSSRALTTAKRAIFALHRGDQTQGVALLREVEESLAKCKQHFRAFPELEFEGTYKAAREEQAEALLFFQYVTRGKLGTLPFAATAETYLAGLSDATGEISRYALHEATRGNARAVEQALAAVTLAVEFMLSLDLTGYARTKFDQAKKNLRSLEQMQYEMSLRR